MYVCPCCGYRTLEGPVYGSYEICTICGWEDDEVQLHYPVLRGGANQLSLAEAQRQFRTSGVCDPELGYSPRQPTENDEQDPTWRPFDPTRDEVDLAKLPKSGAEYFRALDEPFVPYWIVR